LIAVRVEFVSEYFDRVEFVAKSACIWVEFVAKIIVIFALYLVFVDRIFPLLSQESGANDMDEKESIKGRVIPRREAPDYLERNWGFRISEGTLAKMAGDGSGPQFRVIGGKYIVYETTELDRWILATLSEPVRSTADARAKGYSMVKPGSGRPRRRRAA
jgi:hypothetical protein